MRELNDSDLVGCQEAMEAYFGMPADDIPLEVIFLWMAAFAAGANYMLDMGKE